MCHRGPGRNGEMEKRRKEGEKMGGQGGRREKKGARRGMERAEVTPGERRRMKNRVIKREQAAKGSNEK